MGAQADEGVHPLLAGPGLGVHQRRKFFEMRNEYALTDVGGRRVGAVEQVGQSPFAFLTRLFSDLDVALPVTLEVRDVTGGSVVRLDKPWFRWAVDVTGPTGEHLGRIRKEIRLGRARFAITDARGVTLGSVSAQNWRARDFDVQDGHGRRFADVTKRWRGLVTEAFTDADSYAVEFEATADGRQRALALAAALTVDLVMKQKDT